MSDDPTAWMYDDAPVHDSVWFARAVEYWKQMQADASTIRGLVAERDAFRSSLTDTIGKLMVADKRIEKLEGMLAACDENSKRLEAIVEANVEWVDTPIDGGSS